MINSIILLHNGEHYEKFSSELKGINPAVEIILLNDLASLIALPHSLLDRSRLIAYLSGVIVPLSIIKKLNTVLITFTQDPQFDQVTLHWKWRSMKVTKSTERPFMKWMNWWILEK